MHSGRIAVLVAVAALAAAVSSVPELTTGVEPSVRAQTPPPPRVQRMVPPRRPASPIPVRATRKRGRTDVIASNSRPARP